MSTRKGKHSCSFFRWVPRVFCRTRRALSILRESSYVKTKQWALQRNIHCRNFSAVRCDCNSKLLGFLELSCPQSVSHGVLWVQSSIVLNWSSFSLCHRIVLHFWSPLLFLHSAAPFTLYWTWFEKYCREVLACMRCVFSQMAGNCEFLFHCRFQCLFSRGQHYFYSVHKRKSLKYPCRLLSAQLVSLWFIRT